PRRGRLPGPDGGVAFALFPPRVRAVRGRARGRIGTPSITVVFPMYNEEAYARRAVAAARAALETAIPDWEIVIVDDASTDGTAAVADALAREDPRVRVIHNLRNRRLGGALRAGYAAATKELVFYTDADLPVDLEVLPRA